MQVVVFYFYTYINTLFFKIHLTFFFSIYIFYFIKKNYRIVFVEIIKINNTYILYNIIKY